MDETTVLTFWFTELGPTEWFSGGDTIDQDITERFTALHAAVAANEHDGWRTTPEGSLAEVLVLDQFSRNIFRGTPSAFAADAQALALAQVAIAKEFDAVLDDNQCLFLYMPFMHSESPVIHERAIALFTDLGNAEALQYEQIHKDIIDQFGRYPHRNHILGRATTDAEQEFLEREHHDFFAA